MARPNKKVGQKEGTKRLPLMELCLLNEQCLCNRVRLEAKFSCNTSDAMEMEMLCLNAPDDTRNDINKAN